MAFRLNSLSYTYLSQYQQCPQKFYLAFILEIPVALPWTMFFGWQVHDAIEVALKVKMRTGLLPKPEGALASFDNKWDRGVTSEFFRDRIVFTNEIDWSGNDPGKLKELGQAMISSYITEVAPTITSSIIGVEEVARREVKLADGSTVPFTSHLDFETKDAIYDLKTSSRTWGHKRLVEALQPTVYMKQRPGKRFLYIIGVKDIPVRWQIAEIERSDARLAEVDSKFVPEFMSGLAAERFPCKRSYLCRWCGYSDICGG